jgi:hypothetical protein
MMHVVKQKKEVEAIWGKVKSFDRMQQEFELQIKTKCDIEYVEKIDEYMKLLPKDAEIKAQKKFVDTSILKFMEDNEMLLNGYAENKEMVRRFDELLALKMSKISHIEEMEHYDGKLNHKLR